MGGTLLSRSGCTRRGVGVGGNKRAQVSETRRGAARGNIARTSPDLRMVRRACRELFK